MQGTLYVNADAGRIVRKTMGAVLMAHVLDWAGDFRAGDKVFVVVRGEDGGQGVVAAGFVRFDMSALFHAMSQLAMAGETPIGTEPMAVVIAKQDLQLIWPSWK